MRTLVRFRYHIGLSRAGKGRVRKYLAKVTGYPDAQLTWPIGQQRRTGRGGPPGLRARFAKGGHFQIGATFAPDTRA